MIFTCMATFAYFFFPGIDGGGFCPNSTVYCSFGCCGDPLEKQLCCFPIGVIIGCGFGALGTVCILITIFRCRIGKRNTHAQQGMVLPHGDQGNVTVYGNYLVKLCTIIESETVWSNLNRTDITEKGLRSCFHWFAFEYARACARLQIYRKYYYEPILFLFIHLICLSHFACNFFLVSTQLLEIARFYIQVTVTAYCINSRVFSEHCGLVVRMSSHL